MTYYPIVNKSDVRQAQIKFEKALTNNAKTISNCQIGFQGEHTISDLHWNSELQYWSAFIELHNRYWNAFGLEKPTEYKNHAIVCELNFPFKGRNLQIAGILVKEQLDSERVFAAHTGNIHITGGGGGKNKFLLYNRLEHNNEGLIDILWPEGRPDQTNAILVGDIDKDDFQKRVKKFIHKVAGFKKRAKSIRSRT
jgi:hypothetical protein